MKTLLLSFLLLVGFTANATYIPTQETITVGGKTFTNIANLKILYFALGGANGWSTARLQDGTAGYTPSGANKFRVLGIKLRISVAPTAAGTLTIQQADNDSGMATTTASINPVYLGGDPDSAYLLYGSSWTAGSRHEFNLDFVIQNTKYLTFTGDGTSVIHGEVYGYEEP